MAPGFAPDGGRDPRISLDSYRPPQAGQPPASKVLSHQGLPSSKRTSFKTGFTFFFFFICTFHDQCITRTNSFRTKPQHRVSWRHPRSKHWHQLDLILVRRAAIKSVLHTRSYRSADCDTDHSLVCCKIRYRPLLGVL